MRIKYIRQHFPRQTWTFYTPRASDPTDWTATVIVTDDMMEADEWQREFASTGVHFMLIRSEFDASGNFECSRDVTDEPVFLEAAE